MTVNGSSPTVVNKPTLTGSPSTTSVSIVAPPGNDGFVFTAWNQVGGTGNILDQVTTSQNIVADANNTVSATLNGVCAALVPTLYTTGIYVTSTTRSIPLVSGSRTILTSARIIGPASKTFQFTRVDADGNTVLNSGDISPISVVESGSTPHVAIAPVTSGPSNTMFSLTPLSAEPDGISTSITATAPDCSGSQTFPSSFQLSTSAAVLVSDLNAGILAYDQDGTQLGTTPISTTKNIDGLAYSPKSGGYLVAIEPKSSSGGIAFQTLTLSGSVIGSSSITPQNDSFGTDAEAASEAPGNIIYDPADGIFHFALRAATPGTAGDEGIIEEYSISGATATFVNNFSNADDPYCFAALPNGLLVGDDFYNYGTSSSPVYGLYLTDDSGTVTGSEQMSAQTSLAFDSTRNKVISLNGNRAGTVFDEQLNSDATFKIPATPYNGGAYYVSAYNPVNDELYMFSENAPAGLSGATVAQGGSTTSNLIPGAFPGLTAPTQAVVLP